MNRVPGCRVLAPLVFGAVLAWWMLLGRHLHWMMRNEAGGRILPPQIPEKEPKIWRFPPKISIFGLIHVNIRARFKRPLIPRSRRVHTFFSCPFLCFTRNGQNNVTTGPAASRPDPPPGTQGPHQNAPQDLLVEDPRTILQKNHCRLHIGNLAIPIHVPDVEITDFRKRHQIGGFTSSANVSGLGSITSSGAEPSIAV